MTFLWPEIASGSLKLDFVDAGGIRTRYVEAGEARSDEAVIFVHGTAGHLEAFTRNVLPHAAEHRTIALDLVGHGFSDKPEHDYEITHYVQHLLAFCDAIGVRRAHLHGESLGGWVVAQFAIDHPERVATLTLNTAGGLNTDPAVMHRVYAVTIKAVVEASLATVRARLEWLMHDPRQVTDDLVELRHRIYTQPDFLGAIEHILCLQKMDIRLRNVLSEDSLARIEAPTLVIWTDHDPTAPIATGERFVAAIPNAEPLIVMEGCAHWPQWEKPDTFNRIHLDFLRRRHVGSNIRAPGATAR